MQIDYLNGIRGVCALWVVLAHEVMLFLPMGLSGEARLQHLEGPWEYALANLPVLEVNFGVCIFFTISAFVLSLRYWQQERRENACLADAAVRRYFRLAGPVTCAMLCSWLVTRAGWMRNFEASAVTLSTEVIDGNGALVFHVPAGFLEMLQAALYNVYIDIGPAISHQFDFVLWTMPAELQGSFLSFAFLALFGAVRCRDIFYLMICLWAGSSSYLLAFPLGVWLADIAYAEDRSGLRERLRQGKMLAAAALLLGLYLGFFRDVPGNPIYDWLREDVFDWPGINRTVFCHVLGSFFFMYAVLHLQTVQRFFSWHPLVVLGRYSFAVYLVHVTVLCSAQSSLFLHFLKHGHGYGTSFLVSLCLSMPLIALLAFLLDRLADRPSKRLARWVAHKVLG